MPDGDDKLGVRAALDLALSERGQQAQQALLPLAPANGEDERGKIAAGLEPRSAGRPPGSINKKTSDLANYLLSRYRHPVIALAEIYSRPTEALAQDLQCKRLEAFKVQKEAAAVVAEYVAQKMPRAVELDTNADTVVFAMMDEQMIADLAEAQPGEDAKVIDATAVSVPPEPAIKSST